ncbi:MAG: hypothetical protein ACR2JC_04335 [Chloroflexota bacterium]|nr:MAG: hypothetical protein DLM70_15510 [Chloroflexota bacterium]
MDEDHTDQGTSSSHDTGTRKGEEMSEGQDQEAGREDTGTTESGRPMGTATARFSTGINPDAENPIEPDSPELPPP